MSERRLFRRVSLLLVTAAVLLGACATGEAPAQARGAEYHATGRGATFGTAMNNAKMQAVRQFVVDEIGEAAEERNYDLLEEVVYRTRNPNQFVYNETMETLRRENIGTFDDPEYIYELRIRVNEDAVRRALRSAGVDRESGGIAATPRPGSSAEGGSAAAASEDAAAQRSRSETNWGSANEQQRAFIRRFIESMTYMVYYDEERISAEPFLLDLAVGQANSYLTTNGYFAVNAAQVERLKEDQRLVFEEEAGREVSILQWVAQRLNADVYVELDASVSSSSEGNTHYGQANITMRMYETSTGQLLGSVPYRSQRTVSRVDRFDARSNAIQSAVYAAMPRMIDQSQALMEQTNSRGIRYEIMVQNTPDSRMVSRFRTVLRDHVAEVDTISQSPEATHFAVRHYGPLDEVEDFVYTAGEAIPGMEGLYQVIRRGKSITFDTGI